MKQKESSESRNQKMKSSPMINATLIGIMIGIVIWSVAKNNVGFFTLIPLFFIYKLVNGSKSDTENDSE